MAANASPTGRTGNTRSARAQHRAPADKKGRPKGATAVASVARGACAPTLLAQRRKAFAGARQGQRAAHAPRAIARGSEDRPRSNTSRKSAHPARGRGTKGLYRLRDMKRAAARNRPHQKNDYRAAGTRLRDQTERSEERGAGRGERRPRARPERPTRLALRS